MKMTYESLKKIIDAGGKVSIDQIESAIQDQLGRVVTYANSAAKHAGRLQASEHHPWPVADDQKGRVSRRAERLALEMNRLTRLHFWRELAYSRHPIKAASA